VNHHALHEIGRQLRESGAAGVVAILLVTFATTLGGVLWTARTWVDSQLLPAQRPSTVVAVIQPPSATETVWTALHTQFPAVTGGPVAPAGVRDQLIRWFPEFASLFSGLAEASFPTLLDMSVPRTSQTAVGAWLKSRPEVILFESSRQWQERLDRAVWRALWAGLVVACALLVGCGALVLLVVRLLVLDHADEIAIMRLIGAHESEIRLPYLACGTLLGLGGGLAGSVLLGVGALYAQRALPGVEASPVLLVVLPVVGAATACFGAVLGLFSLPSEP
jgi:cell division protein FtsX